MNNISLKELAVPLIKSIDSFNYLLKSHHRRTAVISYAIGHKMGLSEEKLANLVIGAAIHDIGALSVQERDALVSEDVINPNPHCIMAYKMLKSFEIFKDISMTLKHHHIKYNETDLHLDDISIESHIIHFADRIDISISPNKFILDQKQEVIDKMRDKTGTIFHPEVFAAFEKVAKADIFWIDINNMQMEQVLSKIDYKLDVKLSKEQVIEFSRVISRIVDFRSKYTSSHSFTVGRLSHFIGKLLNKSKEFNIKLLVAGYLHDIGKIGIDPRIIEKKGKLDESEFNQIKLHSYYTGQILNELGKSEWFEDILKWTVNHHERNDCSGYPYALGADDLDEGSIIIAFADIISALMEDRPYRPAFGIEKSFEIIDESIADKLDRNIYEQLKVHMDRIGVLVEYTQKKGLQVYNETVLG